MEDSCGKHMTATELLIHSMEQLDKDKVNRAIVILWSDEDSAISIHTNASNPPEVIGLLELARDVEKEPDDGR